MSRARDLADLLDASGDVKSAALDNVPPSNDASALTTGTLDMARVANGSVTNAHFASGAADLSHDTTPQLGGNLDLNSNSITGSGIFQITGDSNKISASNNHLILHDTAETDAGSKWWYIYRNGGDGKLRFYANGSTRLSLNRDGTWGEVPDGTCINTQLFTNSTYTAVTNTNSWTNVWTFNYTPKLNGSKLFMNFSVAVLPEGSNGHNFWLGMYSNSGHTGAVLGQQYWYEISRAAGVSGWSQDQHIMQTFFNTSLGQGNTAYFLLQFQNGTATGTSYFNYSNAHSTLIITEVAS